MRHSLAAVLCLLVLSTMSVPAQSTVAQLSDAGWRAVEKEDADRAAALFREALTMRPRDAVLNLGAGVAAHLQGRDSDASTFLQKALQFDPTLTHAATLLGEIAYREGNLDLAIKTYEAALAYAPRNPVLKQRLDAWKHEASSYQSYETLKDDRFAVMFEGPVEQQLAARATTVLGSAFWRIGKVIGAYPSSPINVILYTEKQFRDITGAPEWAGGGFDGQIRLPVRGALQNLPQFDRMLTHELTHAMLHAVAARNLPAWLNEGLAMYFEGYDAAAVERALASARAFVPLAALQNSFARLNEAQATVAYAESLFAATALLDRIGQPGLAQLLQDFDAGQPVGNAVQRFGFTMTDFEAKLARRVGVTRLAAEPQP
jgi:peptidase MA superfamily protein/tetratricopeptide repeat protein